MPNYRKIITLTQKMKDMIEELRLEMGYSSSTSVIYKAIIDLYIETFPNEQIQEDTAVPNGPNQ